ncbi:hypothetical protein BDZ91DRAFT_792312 [Kalaharituber pfeilii]|nr:hypothetical protein BDZ91DRAFT_792312 [Kalaharituber pfeilii]
MSYQPPSPQTRPPLQSRGTSASDSSSQSHQTGVIKEHWNDLPANFTPAGSRSVSRTGTPLPSNDACTHTDGYGGQLDFETLLSALLDSPTSLSPTDLKLLTSKVQKAVGGMTLDQRNDLSYIFKAVAVDRSQTPAWGRERVVEFMMREKGVASWAIAVRKLVENIV